MTNIKVEVDISGATKRLKEAGVNLHKAVPKLLGRLSMAGEEYMKRDYVTPYRTGNLRAGIHTYPTTNPNSIWSDVNYAWAANVRSRRPGYIEKTRDYIIKQIPIESEKIIKNALKGMNK